jgi:Na+/H+-translocating membrane pyrophosphatase
LRQEYTYLAFVLAAFAVLIFFTAEPKFGTAYTTVAFLIGGITSIASGFIGMRVAVYTNIRTTKECADDISHGFRVAYRGGQVLGFILVSLAILVLQVLIIVYKILLNPNSDETTRTMFEAIAGYGLGGSTVALFGRVGGGIFTKAADVGSDLAGKVV